MNKARRKEIAKVIRDIESVVDRILQDEEYSFSCMPENLQYSQRGCDSEEAQDSLQSAVESLEEAISYLEDIV